MPQSKAQTLEALLALIPDLAILLDPDGRIMLFNKACEALTGYHGDEVIGRELKDLLVPQEWSNIVRQRFADPLGPTISESHETPWLTPSGDERMINWRCTAFRVADSRQPHILGIGTDVTEQRRIEEITRAQSRLLERFFESTMTSVALLDRDFNFIRVNHAYAQGCQRDAAELIGKNHFELYPSEAKAIFDQVISSKRPYKTEARPFKFPDHPERGVTYWDWTLVPVLDDQGEVDLLLLSLHDVTDRFKIEQALQGATDKLRRVSRQLLEIQERERRRIARELHDEIGQGLTVLSLTLENTVAECPTATSERLREALDTTASLVQSVRRFTLDLGPPMLDDLGLLSALLWLFERHRSQIGLDVQFKHNGLDSRLPRDVETALFRITQEALTNIIRHAGVTRAEVAVWITDDTALLKIRDEGGGFNPDGIGKIANGAGLVGMQERAALLDGVLTIDTEIDTGTTITAELPYHVPTQA